LQLKTILRQVPDPRGKQGQDYMLWSILSLIIVSLLCGRRGMKAAFLLGRSLSRRQKAELGFIRGTTPCHATLTETLRVIDAQALADVLGALCLEEGGNARHIAIDGKTMRASKDSEGKAEHVLSAFCGGLQTVLGHEASRGKGLEIPDALKLLERLALKGKIVTGDAIFCQKSIAAKIVERGGDYVFPVKDNQKTLRQDHRNGFQRAGFSPCAHGIAASKRRMGASNGARSTCFLPKPPGFRASGRRFGKSAASSVRAKSRRTASGRRHSTSSSIWFPACPPPPRHRLCWASIAIIGGSRSCIETTT
jgi:predicted transposase YbfD/YdcC